MKLIPYEDLRPLKGVGYSRVQIWRLVKAGTFPAPIRVGKARVAWIEAEINEWIHARAAAREAGPPRAA
jgi:prophage regulatory protein